MRVTYIATALLLGATAAIAASNIKLVNKDKDDYCAGLSSISEEARWNIEDCDDDDDSQCWDTSGGTWFMISPCDDGKLCLEAEDADEGEKVRLRSCSKDARQYWSYDQGNDNEIRLKANSNLCAEPASFSDGSSIKLKQCNGKSSQGWDIEDFDGGGGGSCKEVGDSWAEDCEGKGSEGSCEYCCETYCAKINDSSNCRDKCEDDCVGRADCDNIGDKCKMVGSSWWEDCGNKGSEGYCEDCCETYCDKINSSSDCKEECEDDCIDEADCDEIDDDRCEDVSWKEADRCGNRDSESRCERCCRKRCKDRNSSSNCRSECEDDCENEADCSGIEEEECEHVRSGRVDNCSYKKTEGDCYDCCEYYCDLINQSSDCDDECERECRNDANCEDIDSCDHVRGWEADNCSQKKTEDDCEGCCAFYCSGNKSDRCESECEDDCEEEAKCDEIDSCDYVRGWEANNCSQKKSEDACESCCSWYCSGNKSDRCESECEDDCEKEAKCDEIKDKDDCKHVEGWMSDNCHEKRDEDDCDFCCEWYCKKYDQSSDCDDECENKCEAAARCSNL